MNIYDRLDFSGQLPAEFMSGEAICDGRAEGLVVRLQDSNKALENLLRELELDESAHRQRSTTSA